MALSPIAEPMGVRRVGPRDIPLAERNPKAAELIRLKNDGQQVSKSMFIGLIRRHLAGEAVDPESMAFCCAVLGKTDTDIERAVQLLGAEVPAAHKSLDSARKSLAEYESEIGKLESLCDRNELSAGSTERLKILRIQQSAARSLVSRGERRLRDLEARAGLSDG